MKKRFKKTVKKLQQLSYLNANISSIMSGSSTIPGLAYVANSFISINEMMVDEIMLPLIEELQNLQNNNGPQAQIEKRFASITNRNLNLSPGTTIHSLNIDEFINNQYPKKYSNPFNSKNIGKILQGLIPNLDKENSVYLSKYGPNTVDMRPNDPELIYLLKNLENTIVGKIVFDNEVVGILEPKLIINNQSFVFDLTLFHFNKSLVEFNYHAMLNCVNVDLDRAANACYQAFNLYNGNIDIPEFSQIQNELSTQPNGHKYFIKNSNNSGEVAPLEMTCVVYNDFEKMFYPGGDEYIAQNMLKQLMAEWLRANGVAIDQTAWEDQLDNKLRYARLLEELNKDVYLGTVENCVYQEFIDDLTISFDTYGLSKYKFNFNENNNHDFLECFIVKNVIDPTKHESFTIYYRHDEKMAGFKLNSKYNCVFTFKDETETCSIQVYGLAEGKFIDPTPRMIEYLTSKMLEKRKDWIATENKRLTKK